MIGNQYHGVMKALGPQSAAGNADSVGGSDEPSDDQLMRQFCSKRDQAAFSSLVHRHGPLVWHVCRRVLGQNHDAEDAFQATFVVLLRKAGSVRWQKSIAGWLYQVSHRVAMRSRAKAVRRAALADDANLAAAAAPATDPASEDRQSAVDEEIARLPESLRLPVVMCYVQGLTNGQAADRLGCPEGTVVSRLARARDRLRRRLRARGIAVVGAAALTELLSTGAEAALVPALTKATLALSGLAAGAATSPAMLSTAAAQMARTVVRQMFWQRLVQIGGAVFVGTAIVGSFLVFKFQLWSTERAADGPLTAGAIGFGPGMNGVEGGLLAVNGIDPANLRAAAMRALQGNWVLQEWERAGERLPVDPDAQHLEFAGDRCVLVNITGDRPGPVMADAYVDATRPMQLLDLIVANGAETYRAQCLYEISGDTLRLSIGAPGMSRPNRLSAQSGDLHHSYLFRREKPASPVEPPPD